MEIISSRSRTVKGMNPEEDKIFLCVLPLYYVNNVCRFTNGGAKISTHGY